jgi:MFS superfamily sulfate permease-like transporter
MPPVPGLGGFRATVGRWPWRDIAAAVVVVLVLVPFAIALAAWLVLMTQGLYWDW